MLLNNDIGTEQVSYQDYPYMVYIRVSTDKDEQVSSPENQKDICRHWVDKNNFEWEQHLHL